MIPLRDSSRRLIDTPMLQDMNLSRNLILALRVGDDLLILEHQPLTTLGSGGGGLVVAGDELVVGGGGAQAALLGAVGAVGVLAMLEVEANLVEALLGDEVFALGAQVAAVDDGVDELVRVRAQVAAAFDAPDPFEAEGVPDAAGGDVGFVDEVEDGVGVALGRRLAVVLKADRLDMYVASGL